MAFPFSARRYGLVYLHLMLMSIYSGDGLREDTGRIEQAGRCKRPPPRSGPASRRRPGASGCA